MVGPTAESGRDFFCPMVVAGVLVGQALFTPSPREGLPIQVRGAEITPDSQEWLSYYAKRDTNLQRNKLTEFSAMC